MPRNNLRIPLCYAECIGDALLVLTLELQRDLARDPKTSLCGRIGKMKGARARINRQKRRIRAA